MSGETSIDGRARGGSGLGSAGLRAAVRRLLEAARPGMAGRRGAGLGVGVGAESDGRDGPRRTIAGHLAAEAWGARLSAEADDAAELAAGFAQDALAAVSLAIGFGQLAGPDRTLWTERERQVFAANAHDATERAYRAARLAARLCAEVYDLREHAASALQTAALYGRAGAR